MRKFLVAMVAAMCVGICLAGGARADNAELRAQRQQLKEQQRRERNALKLQQQNMKQSWKNGNVPSAQRSAMRHQMQRSIRDLKTRQKDSMQDLKDRQRSMRDMQRANGQ